MRWPFLGLVGLREDEDEGVILRCLMAPWAMVFWWMVVVVDRGEGSSWEFEACALGRTRNFYVRGLFGDNFVRI